MYQECGTFKDPSIKVNEVNCNGKVLNIPGRGALRNKALVRPADIMETVKGIKDGEYVNPPSFMEPQVSIQRSTESVEHRT